MLIRLKIMTPWTHYTYVPLLHCQTLVIVKNMHCVHIYHCLVFIWSLFHAIYFGDRHLWDVVILNVKQTLAGIKVCSNKIMFFYSPARRWLCRKTQPGCWGLMVEQTLWHFLCRWLSKYASSIDATRLFWMFLDICETCYSSELGTKYSRHEKARL